MHVTVEEMRRYLNLPFEEDDELLMEMIEAAEDVVAARINQPLEYYCNPETGEIPMALKTAIKTLVATWFQNRESVSYGEPRKIPYTFEFILQGFKNYSKNNLYN